MKLPGTRSETLSNVFPFDPNLEPWTPPVAFGVPGTTSSGTQAAITWSGLPSGTIPSLRVGAEGAASASFGLLIEGTAPSALSTIYGTLLVGGQVSRRSVFGITQGTGETPQPFIPGAMVGESTYFQVWIPDTAAPGGGLLTDALEVEVTP